MGKGGSTPPRDLYTETAGELKAKADLAPNVYATEAAYRPAYNALDLQSIDQLLKGIPAGTQQMQFTEQVTKYRNPETGEISDTPKTTNSSVLHPNGSPVTVDWTPIQMPQISSRTVNTPAAPGYLDIADSVANQASAIEARGLSAQRSADIADVQKLGPQSLSAVQTSDPRTAALIESLTTDAQNELNLGTNLSPEQMRLAQQSVRARGQGTLGNIGPSGDLREAIGVSDYAQQLRDKRRQMAAGVAGLRNSVYGDAFNRVLARPASASPAGTLNTALGISRSSGPQMFGSSINAGQVADWNANAAATNAAAKANNQAAMTSAGISAGAGIGAAALAALI